MMQLLRLLADDLTGALDTSAELVGAFGPLNASWSAVSIPAIQGSLSLDSGTRELSHEQAFAIVKKLAPMLEGATIAYKKVDSLLRGPWAAELDACLRTGFWDACIIAPAFAYQGRRTRAGQQYAMTSDGEWCAIGKDIVQQLREQNIEARLAGSAAELVGGVSVFDADTDEDLDHLVEIGRRYSGRILWCGSGGLASALARGTEVNASRKLMAPILGVFGSDHPATENQLATCKSVVQVAADGRVNLDQIKRRLAHGVAFVKLDAPHGSSRAEAAQHFGQTIASLSKAIDPPGALIVAGGETLKAQCLAVGAHALRVTGRLEPGVPRSVIQGGTWTGIDVISKSGAFGPPDLWWKLLNENKLI
jgi:uncharacterized protein YgbK (DUF1537 family)